MYDKKKPGKFLLDVMKRLNISGATLARVLGVKATTLAKWTDGINTPRLDAWFDLVPELVRFLERTEREAAKLRAEFQSEATKGVRDAKN